jgi:hypothetical protein
MCAKEPAKTAVILLQVLSSTGPAEATTGTVPLASGSASTGGTSPTHPHTWTSLLMQSMSIVGRGNGSNINLDVLDSDNSFDSYHTPPPSPCAGGVGLDVSAEVFVTPPSSPAATGTRLATLGMTLGLSIPTPPSTTAKPTLGTHRPRLSDVFAAQVLDAQVPNADPGLVLMTLATLSRAPAGPLVTLGADFIQINCGKQISAMALLETNVKTRLL